MKLKINRQQFVDNILGPSSKLSDNICLDFDNDSSVKTFVTSNDNSTILLAKVPCQAEQPFKCIVPDCKTFLRLFSGIDEQTITLDVDSNVIKYTSSTLKFKYHLLDESYMINKKSISEEKLNSLTFDTIFQVSRKTFSEIIKFNSIIPDAEKLYFVTEGQHVFAKLGDEQRVNTNELTAQVSVKFEGTPLNDSFPINIQNVLLMSFSEDLVTVKVNHKLKVFKFETSLASYIVSGLVK